MTCHQKGPEKGYTKLKGDVWPFITGDNMASQEGGYAAICPVCGKPVFDPKKHESCLKVISKFGRASRPVKDIIDRERGR